METTAFLKRAAASGDQNAQFRLGYRLAFNGKPKRRRWREIKKLWESAAEQGHHRAQFYLGTCYDFALGTKKNLKTAFYWYNLCALRGDQDGQYNVALCYSLGEGVKQDIKKAFQWLTKSAIQGDPSAQRDLGYRYFYGEGTKKNHETAVRWYKKAAKQ